MSGPGLKEKVALVTGGAGGIGRAICLGLAAEGAHVAVLDIEGDGAEETAQLARQAGVEAMPLVADVSDHAAVKSALKDVRAKLGDPLVVACNAGIAGEPTLFRNETKEGWKRQFEVHVDGTFHCIKETLDPMIDTGWGRIVCTSSIAARLGWRGGSAYAAAKAALLGLVRTLALEVASKGITVNAVLPGVIDTAMSQAALEQVRERVEAAIPMKHVGQPEDIAHAVVFLCSERGAYLTGQSISPNGGMWLP